MAIRREPTVDEVASAEALLHESDAALAGTDVLAGGDQLTDELEAEAADRERRSGRSEEANEQRIRKLEDELKRNNDLVRQLLMQGQGVNQVAAGAQAENRRQAHKAMIRALIARGGRAVIHIHPDPNPLQNWPVPLGINGTTIYVKRGVATDVPVYFVGVLEDACKQETVPLLDKDENPVPGGSVIDLLSYQYTLIPGGQAEEVLLPGWRAVDTDLERAANQTRYDQGSPIRNRQDSAVAL